jgi:hypothetical protein
LPSELVKLRECLGELESLCVAKAKELAALVAEISKVLMDLGLSLFQGIPQVLGKAKEVLEAVGTILECLQEALASGVGPWD